MNDFWATLGGILRNMLDTFLIFSLMTGLFVLINENDLVFPGDS
ncbi:hypothetical protein ACFL1X_05295 [Candidatus Hydrogenedentota bacterium]